MRYPIYSTLPLPATKSRRSRVASGKYDRWTRGLEQLAFVTVVLGRNKQIAHAKIARTSVRAKAVCVVICGVCVAINIIFCCCCFVALRIQPVTR